MITIGFFSNNSFLTKAIQWFSGSPINHCAIGFTRNGQSCWLQAGTSGVQIIDRNWLSGLCAEFEVLPKIENEVELAEKKVGEPYGYLTIVGFVIMIAAKWLGLGINNPFYEKAAPVCSEFIIEADPQHLISEFDGLIPANITPGALFDICVKGKSFKRLT